VSDHLRWLPTTRNSMQRVGFLYLVCKAASLNPTTSNAISRKFYASVTRKVKVEWSEYAPYFARHKLLSQRYKGNKAPTEIEYQDVLLGDPSIPSSSGAVTEKAYSDLIDEAVYWRLIRDKNYTLTGRGSSMILIWERDGAPTNPLILSTEAKIASSFWYLDVDGDALRSGYGNLRASNFSREQLGYALADGIDQILKGRRPAFVSERALFRRLRELAMSIRTQEGTTVGSGRARFQASTARAEHLVDLGWLAKNTSEQCPYYVKPSGLPRIIPQNLDKFLDFGFAKAISETLDLHSVSASDDERWELFLGAYRILRNSLGYASYREALVMAQATGLAGRRLAELADIENTVKKRNSSEKIRFAIGRDGRPDNVKVDNA